MTTNSPVQYDVAAAAAEWTGILHSLVGTHNNTVADLTKSIVKQGMFLLALSYSFMIDHHNSKRREASTNSGAARRHLQGIGSNHQDSQ